MAGMVIKTNMSAVRTLNLLNANQSNLTKDLQKVSSGQRVSSAGDDVSGYGISERMRVRIRGLEQCSRNVRTGYNMLSVAAQAVEQQVNILGKMREIALKASDDPYTQKDRDILAGEADQLFDQLEHIAQETNYNGINLLNRSTPDVVTRTTTIAANSFADFDPLHPAQHNTTIGNIFPLETEVPYFYIANVWDQTYGEFLTGYSPTYSATTPPSTGLDFSGALSGHTIDDFNLQGFSVLCTGCAQFVSIVFSTERDLGTGERQDPVTTDPQLMNCRQYIIGINGATTADDLANAVYDGITAANRAHGDTGAAVNVIGEHDLTISRSGASVSITQEDWQQHLKMPIFYEGTKGVNYAYTDTNTQVIAQGLHPWEDLYIQSDTKASQATKIRLWNTTLDALFPPKNTDFLLDPDSTDYPIAFNEADYPDPDEYPDRYEGYTGTALQKKQQLWRDTVWTLTKAGAKQTGDCMRTRQGAQDFLADLDQALNYCLNVGTSFGSQMMRMQISDSNITMNHENTTSAESAIRDADMAKAMTSYTKNQVLLQAAQSMLAQANQNSSSVMSLLQ